MYSNCNCLEYWCGYVFYVNRMMQFFVLMVFGILIFLSLKWMYKMLWIGLDQFFLLMVIMYVCIIYRIYILLKIGCIFLENYIYLNLVV